VVKNQRSPLEHWPFIGCPRCSGFDASDLMGWKSAFLIRWRELCLQFADTAIGPSA
jgi:hypothetical protein